MEVLLNSFWLVMAVGAFLWWRPVRRNPALKRGACQGLWGVMALTCALVIVFPVISPTDDINMEQVAMEDSSRTVLKARHLMQACLRAATSPFLATSDIPRCHALPQVFGHVVVLVEGRVPWLTPISTHEGRSPPHGI
jgi:hypothetical protein